MQALTFSFTKSGQTIQDSLDFPDATNLIEAMQEFSAFKGIALNDITDIKPQNIAGQDDLTVRSICNDIETLRKSFVRAYNLLTPQQRMLLLGNSALTGAFSHNKIQLAS